MSDSTGKNGFESNSCGRINFGFMCFVIHQISSLGAKVDFWSLRDGRGTITERTNNSGAYKYAKNLTTFNKKVDVS